MLNKDTVNSQEWRALEHHQQRIKAETLSHLFARDNERFKNFNIELPGILFDYSKHNITNETLELLSGLAHACDLETYKKRMVSGDTLNFTEGRCVLHTALRGTGPADLYSDGENVHEFVKSTLDQIKSVSENVRQNSDITTIINIGIGGSDLGPRMIYKALRPLADGPEVHYVSNIDGSTLYHRLKKLKPENTMFIIASKTFSTLETLTNAQSAKNWLLESLPPETAMRHFLAVTSKPDLAEAFGLSREHILPMRDWIGGRYSLWSAIGVSIAISNGYEAFQKLLDGAKAIDEHFFNAPIEQNIPTLMGLLGVWYRNFWHYGSQAILPYSHDLRDFPAYLQQLDMESNGKSVGRDGRDVKIKTGPVIFGEAGTNAQHAFMQLIHQSSDVIPSDFILIREAEQPLAEHHEKLLSNALAQSKALMEGHENAEEPHRAFKGNRPSTTLILDRLDSYHLGMLLALYEHKIFVQGIIWTINSFDQWGVELGKNNAYKIIQDFENNKKLTETDSSTSGLFAYLSKNS